ncbi:MAG: translocation/assembly module TamB domain-containing protein [Sediminibacterium sp.]|nr:translocation/assembly module TamB domain-containing protein [Sediminibacterium sp.]
MKRLFKWVGIIILSLVLLVLTTIVFVNTKAGKKIIIDRVSIYLNKKLGNTVQISEFDFKVPKWIELRGVYIKDQKNDTLLYAKYFRLELNMRSLFSSHWVLNNLLIDHAVINIKQSNSDSAYNFQFIINAFETKEKKVTQATAVPHISVGNLRLQNVQFNLNDITQLVSADINKLIVKKLNYKENNISAQNFLMHKSTIQYDTKQVALIKTDSISATVNQNKYMLTIDTIQLVNNQLAYNKLSKPFVEGFDPNHVRIQQNSLLVHQLIYTNTESSANIINLQLTDKTGFKLNQLSLVYKQKDSSFQFQQIMLKSAFSAIEGNITIVPNEYQLKLRNTRISRKEMQLLAPLQLAKLKPSLKEINTILLNVDAIGNEKLVKIKRVEAATNNHIFYINASGTLANISNPNLLKYQLNIGRLSMLKQVLYAFLPTAQQQSIQLPSVLNAEGTLTGSQQTLNPNLFINSEYGKLGVKGIINDFTNPSLINYDLLLNAQYLETGKWVRRDSMLGKLDGIIRVKGRGTDYKTMQLNTNMQINGFVYNKVQYNNANIMLTANNGIYKYTTDINNALLNATIKGSASLNREYPSINALFNIQQANLYGMGFMKDSFNLKTKGTLDFNNLNPANLDLLVKLDSVQIIAGDKKIATDSMLLVGKIDSAKNTVLLLRSAFMDAQIQGKFNYTQLGKIIAAQNSQYIETSTIERNFPSPYSLSTSVTAKPHAVYAALLPGLFFSKNLQLNLALNSKQNDSSIWGNLVVPELTYNGNHIAQLKANIIGIKDSLKLLVIADTLQASTLLLHQTTINGAYSKNGFNATVNTFGQRDADKYIFGIIGKKTASNTSISLQENLFLKNKNWKVNPENIFIINQDGFYVQHMDISNANETILLNSQNAIAGSPIQVKVNHFLLNNITSLLNKDSLLIGGILNANLVASDFNNKVPFFDGNISVDSLMYQQMAVGNLLLKASANKQNGVVFDGSLKGNGNHVTLVGNYNHQLINANIQLDPIQMSAIEPFTQQQIINSRGEVRGEIKISGNIQSPVWNGALLFDSVYTVVKDYGTVLRLNQQTIHLDYPIIRFANFTIRDTTNQSIVVNGSLKHTAGFNFNNNLSVKGQSFTAIDNAELVNSQIYGKGIVDVDAEIKGSMTAPDITGNIGLKKDSKITFVRQQTAASAKDRVGVVEFIDMDTVKAWSLPLEAVEPIKRALYASTLNYNLNIDVDKEAEFVLVIDPITKDELSITGSAQLNARLNPNGSIDLIGAYNLSKGTYQLNYSFLKRKFVLQEGSNIIFSGDPVLAEANITAVYEINASPFDLIGTEISGTANNHVYRQKMPFEVVLKINGPVLEPTLAFDIKLKEKVAGINSQMLTTIENKLVQLRSDPSGMNKEIFALLVMGRFIGEQSSDFFAGSNNGIKTDKVVKESVSRFLSDAVSQIASDLIKGVDIDVNLRTIDDYSSSTQRTDLGLAISKRFLDDRLSISVGKNFTVDGNDPIAKGQNNANLSFLPDVSTAYKLSKDGRYVLRAYRKNQYEAILDGYFIETGVAFSLSMEFNQFKELFKKSKR